MSRDAKKNGLGFPIRSDTNWSEQSQEEISDKEEEGLYYPCTAKRCAMVV